MEFQLERFVGRVINKRYRLDAFIGEGGRGAVFKGYDLKTESNVAIKVLDRDRYSAEFSLTEGFVRWRDLVGQLKHPDILQVSDIHFNKKGIPLYFIAEFIQGNNLRSSQLDLVNVVKIIRHVCFILDFVHRQNVIHQALKPENIFLIKDDTEIEYPKPLLTDLGLPSLTDIGITRLTAVEPRFELGTLRQTLRYLAPEQLTDAPIDPRTDIYALGILLYELAVGRVPFEVDTLSQAIGQHCDKPPPLPRSLRPELPQSLEDIILKAIAKIPDDRFQTAIELAEALTVVTLEIQPETEPEDHFIPIPPELDLPPQQPEQIAPPAIAPPIEPDVPKPEPIRIDYNVVDYLFTTPGETTPFSFLITNQTDKTHRLELSTEGIPESWLSDCPSYLELGPNQAQEIKIKVSPPRASSSRVGKHTLVIVGRSSSLPGIRATLTKRIMMSRFIEFEVDLQPQRRRLDAGSTGRVGIHNQGNSPEVFLVRWQEESGKLRFKPPREKVRVSPGERTEVLFQAVPHQTLAIGSAPLIQNMERHPFSVSVSLDEHYKSCDGEIITRGLVPTRFGLYFVVSMLLATLGCAVWLLLGTGPTIDNVVLNPMSPNCNQPFNIAWLINNDAWWVNVEVAADSMPIAAGLGSDDQYFFPEGVPQPYNLTVTARNMFGTDVKSVRVCKLDAKLTVSPARVQQGTPVIVQWSTINAQTVVLEPFGLLNPTEFTGSRIDTPQRDTTYRLTATNGTDPPITLEQTVRVSAGAAPVVQFQVEPSVVTLKHDKFITLTWQVDNANTATVQPEVGHIVPCDETLNEICNQRVLPAPTRDTVYTLVARNEVRTITETTKVTVVEVNEPEILELFADPPVVTSGVNQSVVLSWRTRGASSIRIDPGIGEVPPFGRQEILAPVVDTTYTLTAQNGDMPVDIAAVTIKVQAASPPIVNSFDVVGSREILIDEDDRDQNIEIVLNWDVANVTGEDEVKITRNFDGKVVADWVSGSTIDRVPAISRQIVYSLFAQKRDGQTATGTVTVTIQKRAQ